MSTMTNKTYIVTGGASGIGAAACKLLTSAGANVVVADLDERKGQDYVETLKASGANAVFVKTDVSDEAAVANMVDQAVAGFGRIDGAFNNAGYPQSSFSVADMPLSDWKKNIDINLTGVFLCIKHELRAMLASGGDAIVNTASIAGVVALPMAAEYTASKHGVCGLTKAAALDYAKHNIRVNAIMPGAVATPMLIDKVAEVPELKTYLESVHPIGRFAQPEEIAQMAVWLLSDLSSYVTGSCLPIDGGYTVG